MNKQIMIKREDFEILYRNHTNDYVCEYMNISMPTLIRYLKNNGIRLKGKGNRKFKSKIIFS